MIRVRILVVVAALVLATLGSAVANPKPASAAGPSFVQTQAREIPSGKTDGVAFRTANTAGNLIVATVLWNNAGAVSLADSRGNAYTGVAARRSWGSNWSEQTFFAKNVAAGANTVTATFATSISGWAIVYIHEYAGLDKVNPLDGTTGAIGTATAVSSGALTTTATGDLLFAAAASTASVTAAGTGWTTRSTASGNRTQDRLATAPGPYTATATQNGSSWVMRLVAFRATSGAPGPPSKLALVQAPSDTAVGAAMTPAVKVAVEDANGNVETSDNATQVSLAIATNPGGGTLSGGSAVTVASGIATFSGLSIDKVGNGYTLTASSSPSYTAATSAGFNVSAGAPGPPSKLAFIQGPSDTAVGAAMTPAVKVAVEDANGNVETSDNATQVSLAIATNPGGGTLSGGSAVTVASGIATFSGLSIDKVGNGYTLTASSSPSYTAATSAAFNVSAGAPGPPSKLAFIQGPSDTAVGAAMTPAVKVAVEDANGNVETSDNATQVSLAIATNPGGGTLSGGSAVTVASGIATFSGLSIDKVGNGYTLTASSSPSYTAATSAAFNVSAGAPGPPSKLAFIQGPSDTAVGAAMTPAVKVAVEDANGNVETSDNATQVSLAIATNPGGGTLSGGSAVTVASGIATFSGLSIDKVGNGYTLTASSSPSYTAATSAAFNITTQAPSAWTTYLQGNDRSGFASGESGFNPTSVKNLHLAWQASDTAPNNGVFSQPVVSNGLVYWGSNDGYERATDTSGNLVWQTNLGRTNTPACTDPSDFGISSTPTITTDVPVGGATSVLYVGGGNSKLYALNAATGAVLWSYDVGGNPNTFIWDAPLVYGNSVYIGVSSFGDCPLTQGQVLRLNRVTGALQNTFNVVPNGCTGGGVWNASTLDAAAGTIYFTTGTPSPDCPSTPGGPSIYELRASDLSLVGSWTIPLAQQTYDVDFGATPTLFNGVIGGQSVPLVGAIDKNGVFYAFKRDAIPSGPVWQTRIATGGANPTTGNGPIAPAAFDGTTLYVGGDNTSGCSGTVNALNPSTGAFIWKHCFTDGGFVEGGVTVTSGGVVAVGEGSNIALVSAATGASLFIYAAAGPFWGPPSVVGGTLYEGDMSGNLYALTSGGQATGPQFVQVNSATPQTNQSTVNVPYAQDQAAGDLNIVAIGWNDTTSTITGVTDSAGNTYQVAAPTARGPGVSQAIYFAPNIRSAAASANKVTVVFSNPVPYADVRITEYSGLDASSPLDKTASAAGTATSASSGNVTTGYATELIFGAGMTTGGFSGSPTGFTTRLITIPDADIVNDRVVTTTGTNAALANVSGGWVMQVATFRAAGQ